MYCTLYLWYFKNIMRTSLLNIPDKGLDLFILQSHSSVKLSF